jgi:two-component system sensor histidine kinase CpxA
VANILRNAQRAAGAAGRIVVTSRIDGNETIITVGDSGPGVPEAELSKIFDAFYRIDPSRDRTTGGAGLGLAIVKTCVESCGGFVAARNRTPHGLEVSIRLPAATPPLAIANCANADAST